VALKDVDAAERAELIRIAVWLGPALFVILGAAWARLSFQGSIPGWLLAILIILDLPLIALAILGIHAFTNRASRTFVHGLYAVGDIPPPRSYPRQDVMLVRGQFQEAADYFRDHLTVEPEDNEARLRLADLLEQHLNDFMGAEQLYLEVRGRHPSRGEEMRAANGLIDLYRKHGNPERLLVELARFRDGYPGTPGADAAARLLTELKTQRS
jgi:hypothetical protein